MTRKREPRVPGVHNYLEPFFKATSEAMKSGLLERGGMSIANIRHDKWCGIYCGSICNCNPEIEIQPLARPEEIN